MLKNFLQPSFLRQGISKDETRNGAANGDHRAQIHSHNYLHLWIGLPSPIHAYTTSHEMKIIVAQFQRRSKRANTYRVRPLRNKWQGYMQGRSDRGNERFTVDPCPFGGFARYQTNMIGCYIPFIRQLARNESTANPIRG